jgi:NAD(P)H-dependent FMN reductase
MIALADYPLPFVDAEAAMPDNAVKLARQFSAHDALFIATPEYNASIPPLLKNALDWIGLVGSGGIRGIAPFEGLTVALGTATDRVHGGVACLQHLRAVLVSLGALVVSEEVLMTDAAAAFGEDGMPAGADRQAMLNAACRALIDHCTPGRGR